MQTAISHNFINEINRSNINNLTLEQLARVKDLTIIKRLVTQLDRTATIEQYNEQTLIDKFLSKYKGVTLAVYTREIKQWQDYCFINHTTILQANRLQARAYLTLLEKQGKTGNTIALKKATLRSFYSFLELDVNGIFSNIFSKQKTPPCRNTKKKKFYADENLSIRKIEQVSKDLDTIIHLLELNKRTKKARNDMSVMIFIKHLGCRVSSFEHMQINLEEQKFTTISKGKKYTGFLPPALIEEIKQRKGTFDFFQEPKHLLTERLKKHFACYRKQGYIKNNYTVHDFRHWFALTDYIEHRDIYRLSTLLNHSSVAITQHYLKGFNLSLLEDKTE